MPICQYGDDENVELAHHEELVSDILIILNNGELSEKIGHIKTGSFHPVMQQL